MVDADGSVVALWTMRTAQAGSLWATVKPAGASTFPRPVELVRGGGGHDVESAQAVVDGSGQVNIVFYDQDPNGAQPYVLTRPSARLTWTDPTPFGSGAAQDISPVVTPSGEAFVISDNAGDYVAVPHLRGGAWGAPEPIWSFPTAGVLYSPQDPVGQASGTGTVDATWGIFDGSTGEWQLMSAVRDPRTGWQTPEVLDSASDPNFNYIYRTAADNTGHFTVVTPSPSGDLKAYTSDSTGTSWTTSVVAPGITPEDWFNVVSDRRGDTAVLFERAKLTAGISPLFITIRRHDSTQWSKPQLLSRRAYRSSTDPGFTTAGLPFTVDNDPAVAVTQSNILVIWSDETGATAQRLRSLSLPW